MFEIRITRFINQLKTKKMKTLNFDLFEQYVLTNEEMLAVRGGDDGDGDPTPTPPPPPIKL
jgi:hypothetical protein